ncbi:cytosolic phospholipase A2 gamma-like isoform X2 [Colossoma macropomum]|uniref:cytosolic phospholipase A2 gamma-like isoform X2 n=1 Tax=Colossoma macropomum TaxID=42526 RepID=UPI001864C9F7|nr:cytosolic phospholipase A2 gamma-like isoform X2 [Colossoma macropomum]
MDQDRSCKGEVRIGHSLNEAERQHLARRIKTVLHCLKQNGIYCSEDELPNIAVLGSGGGLRAMIALLGSLSQLKEDKLLDCIMYLCGVSGSTWCMASLYKELDWSTKLKTVKENIVQRLAEGSVNWSQMGLKLAKYYSEKDNFSLTDVWAALIVSHMVKEIDEHRISEQRGNYTNDPYPIYTVIDKQCKYDRLNADVWFEITPDESGYSLSGAFVDSSCLRSQFENGQKIKDQPETDMLYLQGLCGSAFADMEEILKLLYEALKHLIKNKIGSTEESQTSQTPDVQNGCEVLLTLVDLNLCMLKKEDPKIYLQTMKNLLKDKHDEAEQMTLHLERLMTSEGKIPEAELKDYTLHLCSSISDMFKVQGFLDKIWIAIVKAIEKMVHWIWGTTYDYLYKMKVEDVDPSVLDSKTREYEDAGALLNSPYFSVLRQERDIDLIISVDCNGLKPFETVVQTAELCKELKIPFPEVAIPPEGKEPQDFYVFRGYSKAPTVIHIPLFNAVNCKGEVLEWMKRYHTFRMDYSHSEITDLLDKAGLNIKNNKEKLLKEIENVIKEKKMK